jgi:4-hydroxybenzoate polyprenyltransferase
MAGRGEAVSTWLAFSRLSVVGATLSVVLIGLCTGAGAVDITVAARAVAVAILFHIGVFVMNDILDRDIDRTDPRRSRGPIAAGRVHSGPAWVVVLLTLAAGAGEISPGGGLFFYAGATAGVSLYNVFGKRCPVPPVTDAVQGGGWGLLSCVGASLAGGLRASSIVLAAAICIYVMLVNGMQGSLRDVANDARHGARTTATFFGCSATSSGLSRGYIAYGMALQLLLALTATAGVGLAAGDGAQAPVAVTVGGQVVCTALVWCALRDDVGSRRSGVLGLLHIVLALWTLTVVMWIRFGLGVFALTSIPLLLPWLGGRVVRSLLTGSSFWRGEAVR